jgi:hypothetical protein
MFEIAYERMGIPQMAACENRPGLTRRSDVVEWGLRNEDTLVNGRLEMRGDKKIAGARDFE